MAEIVNRKASFEYQLLDKYKAGIVLSGTEIKSIRAGKVNLGDAYCIFTDKGELVVRNMHISEFSHGSHYNHKPIHDRKLLLNKTELRKIRNKTKEKGLTIIPIKVFFSETGFAKLEIAVAKGKKLYDKRESLKEKEATRRINQDV